jgi:hypothetical protein
MATPRLLPDVPLPPYTFVPGRSPHPVSEPAGHQYGVAPAPVPPIDPADWRRSRDYLRGFDLFNHGYYWEAHEAWEGLWHAAGRTGLLADFLKGLIKLAAAGVKVRQGKPRGVASHAGRAAALFAHVAGAFGGGRFLGLAPADLADFARQVEATAATPRADRDAPVVAVFDFVLSPGEGGAGPSAAAGIQ